MGRLRLASRKRGFEKHAHVFGGALHGPVLLGQFQRTGRIVAQVQLETGLLTPVDMAAAPVHRGEARLHVTYVALHVRAAQHGLEVRLGLVVVAEAFGRVGQQALDVGLHGDRRLGAGIFDQREQHISLFRVSGERAQLSCAQLAVEVAAYIVQMHATVVRGDVVALHHRHGGEREPGLHVAGVAHKDRLQFRARFAEEMAALQNDGVTQHDRYGDRLLLHPRIDYRLGASQVARVARGAAVPDIGVGQFQGALHVLGAGSGISPELVEKTDSGIGGGGHVLQYRVRGSRGIRHAVITGPNRCRDQHQRQRNQKGGAAPSGARRFAQPGYAGRTRVCRRLCSTKQGHGIHPI